MSHGGRVSMAFRAFTRTCVRAASLPRLAVRPAVTPGTLRLWARLCSAAAPVEKDAPVEAAEEAPARNVHHFPPPIRDPHYRYVWFFRYTPVADPNALRKYFHKQWYEWGVYGRVFIAGEGVNAQMMVPVARIPEFEAHVRDALPALADVRISYGRDVDATKEALFPNLYVRVRPHLVHDGLKTLLNLEDKGASLSPKQWQDALLQNAATGKNAQPGQKGVLIDCRNLFESDVGRFRGAVQMRVDYFRESFAEVERILGETGADKHTPVYLYCTGGIRCVKVGAYLRTKGFEKVASLEGGINAYIDYVEGEAARARAEGKAEPERLFVGKNYVFDGRGLVGNETERATADVLSKCIKCGSPGDVHINCANAACNALFIVCPSCAERVGTIHHGTIGAGAGKAGAVAKGKNASGQSQAGAGETLIASDRRLTQRHARMPCSDECEKILEKGTHAPPSQSMRFRRGFHTSAHPRSQSSSEGGYVPPYMRRTPTSVYCEAHTTPLSPHCVAAEASARAHDPSGAHMVSGHLQGRLLTMLAATVAPALALDVGTYTGFSAMSIAEGLDLARHPSASVVSLEKSERFNKLARENAASHPRTAHMDFLCVDAVSWLTRLAEEGGRADFVYLDADKNKYMDYYDIFFTRRLLSDRGLLVADNVLFHGFVANDPAAQGENMSPSKRARTEQMAESIRRFNDAVVSNPRLDCVTLPVRDGAMLVRWKADT